MQCFISSSCKKWKRFFKSQVIEFNGKTWTEIPITCTCSVNDGKILNELQKGNRVEIIGNFINNNKDGIIGLVTYIVYLM